MYVFGKDKPFILTFKIDLSEEVGGTDVFIELREPNTLEWFDIRKKAATNDESQIAAALKEHLPGMMIDHNFYKTETEKMDAAAVVDLLYGKMTVATKIMQEFFTQVSAPFQSKTEQK